MTGGPFGFGPPDADLLSLNVARPMRRGTFISPYPDFLTIYFAGRRPGTCTLTATEDDLLSLYLTRPRPRRWRRTLFVPEYDLFTLALARLRPGRGAILMPEHNLFTLDSTRFRWGRITAAVEHVVTVCLAGAAGRRSLRFPVADYELVALDVLARLHRRRAPVILSHGATVGHDQRAGGGAAIVLAEEVRLRAGATRAVLGARTSNISIKLFVGSLATSTAAIEIAFSFVVEVGGGICTAGPHGGWFGEGDRRAGQAMVSRGPGGWASSVEKTAKMWRWAVRAAGDEDDP